MALMHEEFVLWPELSQFGAKISYVQNPSIERALLKFTIYDRMLFAAESGHRVNSNINTCIRAADFVYCANEIRSEVDRRQAQAMRRGLAGVDAEREAQVAREVLVFYSSTTQITLARLQKLVPRLTDHHLKMVSLDSIKHLDFQFRSNESTTAFIVSQQQLRGAELGVFFTTPADRDLMSHLHDVSHSLHEVLEYRDMPPVEADRQALESSAAAELKEFHPVRAVELAVRHQTLGLDGKPLRAPRLKAALVGYTTMAAAMAANGGTYAGVETQRLPYGIPIGFHAETERMLVLKDARFIEYGPDLCADYAAQPNVQKHIDFVKGIIEIRGEYQTMSELGLLEVAAWVDLETTTRVKVWCENLFEAMKRVLAPFDTSRGFVEVKDIAIFGSQRQARFDQYYAVDFQHFLEVFRTQMFNAVQRRYRDLLAAQFCTTRFAPVKRMLPASPVASLDGPVAPLWTGPDVSAMKRAGVPPEIASVICECHAALPKSAADVNVGTSRFVSTLDMVRQAFDGASSKDDLVIAFSCVARRAGMLGRQVAEGGASESQFRAALGETFIQKFVLELGARSTVETVDERKVAVLIGLAQARTGCSWNSFVGHEAYDTSKAPGATAPRYVERRVRDTGAPAGMVERREPWPVSPTELRKQFNLASVKFGIWAPGAEHRDMLVRARKALSELAAALGQPEDFIGLGGTLSLCFGGRGEGAMAAQFAYFEASQCILHVPGFEGSVQLAHAWAGAFDDWLQNDVGVALKQNAGSRSTGAPVPLMSQYGDLVRSLKVVAMSVDEIIVGWSQTEIDGRTLSTTRALQERCEGWIEHIAGLVPQAFQVPLVQYGRELLTQRWEVVSGLAAYGVKCLRDADGLVESVAKRVDECLKTTAWRANVDLARLPRLSGIHTAMVTKLQRAISEQPAGLHRKNRQFFGEALQLDEARSGPHWADDRNLLERAFTAWVSDRLSAVGSGNVDLVGASDDAREVERSLYPQGREREEFNRSFDMFFASNSGALEGISRLGVKRYLEKLRLRTAFSTTMDKAVSDKHLFGR